MMIRFARKSPEHTEISDGIFEVGKIDVRRQITLPRPVKDIDNFMVFECLRNLQSKRFQLAQLSVIFDGSKPTRKELPNAWSPP